MAFYQVRFLIGQNNNYIYPQNIGNVVWKNTAYHFSEHVMVGETDGAVKADGKDVIALTPAEAAKRVKKMQESFPKVKEASSASADPGRGRSQNRGTSKRRK